MTLRMYLGTVILPDKNNYLESLHKSSCLRIWIEGAQQLKNKNTQGL